MTAFPNLRSLKTSNISGSQILLNIIISFKKADLFLNLFCFSYCKLLFVTWKVFRPLCILHKIRQIFLVWNCRTYKCPCSERWNWYLFLSECRRGNYRNMTTKYPNAEVWVDHLVHSLAVYWPAISGIFSWWSCSVLPLSGCFLIIFLFILINLILKNP